MSSARHKKQPELNHAKNAKNNKRTHKKKGKSGGEGGRDNKNSDRKQKIDGKSKLWAGARQGQGAVAVKINQN